MRAELFHADGRTDGRTDLTKLTVASAIMRKRPKSNSTVFFGMSFRGEGGWKSTLKLCMELPSISLPSHHVVIFLQVSSVYRGTLYLYTARPSISGTGWSAKDDNRKLTTPVIFYGLTTWQHPTPSATVRSLTLRLLMSYIYIYGAPILDVSRSHTTQQSR